MNILKLSLRIKMRMDHNFVYEYVVQITGYENPSED